jgi:catechol 2,3-dioxygenase-like lactoylglutathione lyase family enzyme
VADEDQLHGRERRFGAVEVLSSRVIVYPRDFARTVAWYDDVLGLARYREFGTAGRITGVVYFLGSGFLEVSSHGEAFGAADGSVRLWLQVRGVDAETARLAAAGASVLEEPEDRPWGLREASVADPDGLRICLVQVPEDHPLRRRT